MVRISEMIIYMTSVENIGLMSDGQNFNPIVYCFLIFKTKYDKPSQQIKALIYITIFCTLN